MSLWSRLSCSWLLICTPQRPTTTTSLRTSTTTGRTTSTTGRTTSTTTGRTTSTTTGRTTSTTTGRTTSTTSSRTTSTTSRTTSTTSRTTSTTTSRTTSTSRTSTSTTSRTSTSTTSRTSSMTSLSLTTRTETLPSISTVTTPSNTVTLTTGTNPTATVSATAKADANVAGTILVIVRDATAGSVAAKGLAGYGIPYETLVVPSTGTALPVLNTTTGGNYGGIIVVSGVTYDKGGTTGYVSALTNDQWNQLYAYQVAYHVRMVQYDNWPTADYGVSAQGGCCGSGVEQLFSFTNTAAFAQSGLKTGAGLSTIGLYHYPSTVIHPENTTEIAQFASATGFANPSTAAVINNFNGREQMVFFLPFAQDWSPTSNVIQHSYITWLTRGLYAGHRRVLLDTQIDDMLLETDMYYPNGTVYRVTANDLTAHANWVGTVNAKLNPGSSYTPEIGHNGNGVMIESLKTDANAAACSPGPIDYENCHCDTALEYQKPLGQGISVWPATPTTYTYTAQCLTVDPLNVWFSNTANRDKFFHMSHTFTHLELNNATYSDALKEIQFNQAFLTQAGFAAGKFSSNALIPPAITGLHNGDVLKAWSDAGLTNAVGDNTRPVLKNSVNDRWPYITDVATNGFAGFTVIPRWATRIYYNCDTGDCTTKEWIDTSAGSGTFQDLLAVEKSDTTRHLFGLYHDPYMFHQANLRVEGVAATTINGVSAQISIFQAWVETVVQEFVRVANWPILSEKQQVFAQRYLDRMARDQCGYKTTSQITANKLTGITVTANGNTCGSLIPVTVPGPVTNTQGFKTEQIGNDPLTIWVQLSGSPVSFTLTTPVAV